MLGRIQDPEYANLIREISSAQSALKDAQDNLALWRSRCDHEWVAEETWNDCPSGDECGKCGSFRPYG